MVNTAPRPPVGPQFGTLRRPQIPRRSGFEIYISGQIDFGDLKAESGGLCVKYDFVKGETWQKITVSRPVKLRVWKWAFPSTQTRPLSRIPALYGTIRSKWATAPTRPKAGRR